MNAKPYLSLAAAAITILPVGQLLAQATGTSHPESDNEIVATGGSHYLKPSPAAPRTPAAASDSTAYGSYQPYVATPQPATVIIQPVTMPATPTTPSSVADASVVYGPYQPYVAPGQTRQLATRPSDTDALIAGVVPTEVASLEHFYPAHVNHEGTIVGTSSGKNTALAFGLVTASATASGALAGGSIGAVVGFGVGAGIATAWWLRQDRLVEVPGGTKMVFTLDSPLQINPAAR
jgi:hypothetical protein